MEDAAGGTPGKLEVASTNTGLKDQAKRMLLRAAAITKKVKLALKRTKLLRAAEKMKPHQQDILKAAAKLEVEAKKSTKKEVKKIKKKMTVAFNFMCRATKPASRGLATVSTRKKRRQCVSI